MKYLSVCSGIEAASVAWHHLGWTPVGFSEIEPFPCQVLAHRFPNVRNYGDMRAFKEWGIERGTVDILVGGTPCQSFSVAGLRQGMCDPRGNLALVYMGMVDQIRPTWIVWENVPGVLSTNKGRDFGAILGALGELGYGWAYRVLDAQFFGVPQRRRRVFLVGHASGDARRAAEVLFERDGMRGYSAPRRKTRQNVASGNDASPNGNHRWSGQWQYPIGLDEEMNAVVDGFGTLKARMQSGGFQGAVMLYEANPTDSRITGPVDVSPTVTARFGTGGNQTPLITNATADSLTVGNARVRRLTPIECERLQGFPDGWTDIRPRTPDSPRYKALGNSMAVPVMRWIGERIHAHHGDRE